MPPASFVAQNAAASCLSRERTRYLLAQQRRGAAAAAANILPSTERWRTPVTKMRDATREPPIYEARMSQVAARWQ